MDNLNVVYFSYARRKPVAIAEAPIPYLAYIYGELGDYPKQLELNENAYELSCKVLGEDHPNTLTFLNNLAVAYWNLGEYQKGLKLNEKVYELRCKVSGEDHPETVNALNNLNYMREQLDEQ